MTAAIGTQLDRETGPAGSPPVFYLGTHKPYWLTQTAVPLFIADQHLRGRKTLPRALGPWALDSGGFMQLKNTGRWQFTVRRYLANIARYQAEIGNLAWASPMDWMCEQVILDATGKNVAEHQWLTLANYIEICDLWRTEGDGPCPVIPVLQGWTNADYYWHRWMYEAAGIDLAALPAVGLGTVCRRQSTMRIGHLVMFLDDLRLHGFGVKKQGLENFGRQLASADSMAWSYDAYRGEPLPGHTHQTCSNCLAYALKWRREMLGDLGWNGQEEAA